MYIRKDGYYKLAKQQGFRSRASFKLIQLNDSYHIIRQGSRVLDIGAAPGGWMQVLLHVVGSTGTVVGLDILDILPIHAPNAVLIKGDVRDPSVQQQARAAINGKFDTVVSDISINISGNAPTDTEGNLELSGIIVSLLPGLLKSNGNFLIKLFYSPALRSLQDRIRGCFREVFTTKPPASRRSSSELYLIARGFKPVHVGAIMAGDR